MGSELSVERGECRWRVVVRQGRGEVRFARTKFGLGACVMLGDELEYVVLVLEGGAQGDHREHVDVVGAPDLQKGEGGDEGGSEGETDLG